MARPSSRFSWQPLTACLFAVLAGCGGGAVPPSAGIAVATQPSLAQRGLPPAIIVGNFSGANILKFALGAKGNAAPIAAIAGKRTGIQHADNVALDTGARTYASLNGKVVAVFSSEAHGNAKPIRVLAGPNTLLTFPIGVAVDSNGYLYVADCGAGNVKVFAPGAGGNVAPVRVISLSSGCTIEVSVDKNNQLYVTSGDNVISVFSSESTGNALLRTILESQAAGSVGIRSIAVDGHGYAYAGNLLAKDIRVFSPNARGSAKPVRRIAGSKTHLGAATGLALDSSGDLYVTVCQYCHEGSGKDSILVFAPRAKGNVTPIRVIAGSHTLLDAPTDLSIRP